MSISMMMPELPELVEVPLDELLPVLLWFWP